MNSQLLKKIIESNAFKKDCPDVFFKGNQLSGYITIHAGERVEMLNNMFRKNHFSYSYEKSKPTVITIATNEFHCDVDGIEVDKLTDYCADDLGYKSSKESHVIDSDTYNFKTETISTVFTVMAGDEVAGFYDFNLCLILKNGQASLDLYLNQIYVKPKFRGSTYWMDLTISVYTFLGLVFYHLARLLKKPHYLDVYVHADLASAADEKIAVFIEHQLRAIYTALPPLSFDRPAFIGNVHAEMSY